MGHTGDQRAEAGQLFSLNQPILKLFLFRDLPDDNPGLLLFAVAAVYREEAILVHALLYLELTVRLAFSGPSGEDLDLTHQQIPPGLCQRQHVIHQASDQSSAL